MVSSRLFGKAIQARTSALTEIDCKGSPDVQMYESNDIEEGRLVSSMSSKSGRRVIGLQSRQTGPLSDRLTSDNGPNLTRPHSRTVMRTSMKKDFDKKQNWRESDQSPRISGGRYIAQRRGDDYSTRRMANTGLKNSAESDGSWKHDRFHGSATIGSTIFIRHLPPVLVGRNPSDGLEERLMEHFSSVGSVMGVKVERSSMPSALVYFMRAPDAARAVEQLNGKPVSNFGGNVVLKFKERLNEDGNKKENIGDDENFHQINNRRVVRTQGHTADDEAWMCDSRTGGRGSSLSLGN